MATRESYEPGAFAWVELITSDRDAAKAFYKAVLGWEYEDNDMGEQGVYSMGTVDGHNAAGLMQDRGVPPHWNSYIAVASADESAEKAKEAGALVAVEPFDVMDAGRMAVLKDPSGAMVSIWEARGNPGAGVINQHGALTWNDLQTRDVEAASKFYSEVFGWEIGEVEDAPDGRVAVKVGDRLNGGMANMAQEIPAEVPPHWLACFAVDDVAAALRSAGGAGGQVMAGPFDVPTGVFAVAADPQGAVFAVYAGEFDD